GLMMRTLCCVASLDKLPDGTGDSFNLANGDAHPAAYCFEIHLIGVGQPRELRISHYRRDAVLVVNGCPNNDAAWQRQAASHHVPASGSRRVNLGRAQFRRRRLRCRRLSSTQPRWQRADAVVALTAMIVSYRVRLTAGDPECVLAMILEYRPFARAGLTIIERAALDRGDPPRSMTRRDSGRRDRYVTVTLDRILRLARQQAGLVSLKHKCSWPLSGAMVHRKWEWD